jgi:undecaprenyl phosphate N,N'-diacetylbacillosamine 1-phosphate transferase
LLPRCGSINTINCSPVYKNAIKPVGDFIVALSVLLLASPIILLAMVALAFANKGSIWFLQWRPGRGGELFQVIKFKTMTDQKDEHGDLLPDDFRLTKTGQFIRATSLDELPQLINVLKGEMSIVGPRPLLIEYLSLYNNEQRRRHEIKPGITGWAQVNGRNAISWQQKFAFDVWYVDHLSFLLDIKIVLLTVIKVFKSEGISSATSLTMEKFRGNN